MAYDAAAQALAIKAIGTVESNLDYTAVNYGDPITIGVMQWYGTRAAALLQRMITENPSSITAAGVPASLTGALTPHPATDAWWNDRYLTRAEGDPLKAALNANKSIQNSQATTDLAAYLAVAQRAGIDDVNNTQMMLLFFVAYHQSPRRALAVVAGVGPSSNIDRYLAALLNEPVLGQYRTRYNTATTIIKSGDSSGVGTTPGPAPAPTPEGGDTAPGVDRLGGTVSYVERVGDALHVHLRGPSRVLVCQPLGSERWRPVQDAGVGADVPAAPDNPTPTVPPSSGAAAVRSALVAWMMARIDRYAYSQGGSRMEPEKNLYTDCSGLVHYAYQQVAGIEIGSYTGNQYNKGTSIYSGSWPLPTGSMVAGDLIFYCRAAGDPYHVEMYDGAGKVVGHGGPDAGPDLQTLAQWGANYFYVRRHVN